MNSHFAQLPANWVPPSTKFSLPECRVTQEFNIRGDSAQSIVVKGHDQRNLEFRVRFELRRRALDCCSHSSYWGLEIDLCKFSCRLKIFDHFNKRFYLDKKWANSRDLNKEIRMSSF